MHGAHVRQILWLWLFGLTSQIKNFDTILVKTLFSFPHTSIAQTKDSEIDANSRDLAWHANQCCHSFKIEWTEPNRVIHYPSACSQTGHDMRSAKLEDRRLNKKTKIVTRVIRMCAISRISVRKEYCHLASAFRFLRCTLSSACRQSCKS